MAVARSTRRAAPLACALALTALALPGCTGNAPPPNYATTGPSGADQGGVPATSPPEPTGAPAGDDRQYEQCPDALVDAWLHLGTGDVVFAQEFAPHAVAWGSQPTGDAEILCAVGLDHPDGAVSYALTVLTGETVTEDVASAAAAEGLEQAQPGQTGAVATYASADELRTYTLFGPPDRVLAMSGIQAADTAYLLEGTSFGRP